MFRMYQAGKVLFGLAKNNFVQKRDQIYVGLYLVETPDI